MADLDSINATEAVRIVGSNTSGGESTPVRSTTNGDLGTVDVPNTSARYGNIALSTTPVLLNIGGTNLSNRKNITFDNTTNVTVYWGYDNTVSSTNFAGRIFKDQQAEWAVGPTINVYLVIATSTGTGHSSEAA